MALHLDSLAIAVSSLVSSNVFLSACITGGVYAVVKRFAPSDDGPLTKGKGEVEPREDL